MPLPVHDPRTHNDPKIMKARLKMEMAAAEMLYSGMKATSSEDMISPKILNNQSSIKLTLHSVHMIQYLWIYSIDMHIFHIHQTLPVGR